MSTYPETPSAPHRVLWLSAACALAAAIWIPFGTALVPSVIEHAYSGTSWSPLNHIIAGQDQHPVEFYLGLWRSFAFSATGAIVVFWLLALLMTSASFQRRCVGLATPGTLGAIRMWTCGILLVSTLWDDLGSLARLPLELHFDMGVMRFLHLVPGFEWFLTNEPGLRAWQWATEIFLFLGMIGWRTRLVIPLSAFFALVMNGAIREVSGVWHQNLVAIYMLLVLSFTPSGDGFSVDRLRRIWRGQPVPDAGTATLFYGWARYACWVPFALTYASAGFSKIRATGLDWVSATSVRALLYEQTLYPRSGNVSISLHLAGLPDWVFTLLGTIAVAGEALFISVLFSRIARKVMPAVEVAMHVGIIFLQNIFFVDYIALLLIFYNLRGLRRRVASAWLARSGAVVLLFDGDCAWCRRVMRLLSAMDLFGRLESREAETIDLSAFRRVADVEVRDSTRRHEMCVIAGGEVQCGTAGYRVVARALPALWVFVPLLAVPPIARALRRAYQSAARRANAVRDPAAGLTEAAATLTPAVLLRGGRQFALTCGLAVAAVIAVQFFVWANRAEFYPFTTVQMFTDKPRTTIVYYKTLGRLESGALTRIQLEDTLPVMSINGRYEQLFMFCFNPDYVGMCKRALAVLGTAYNERARADRRLTALEIQKWKWDFRTKPADPAYGQEDSAVAVDLTHDAARTSDVLTNIRAH